VVGPPLAAPLTLPSSERLGPPYLHTASLGSPGSSDTGLHMSILSNLLYRKTVSLIRPICNVPIPICSPRGFGAC
jgi:hypothetical protein